MSQSFKNILVGTAIITDPLVKPTQHSPRRVPIALRDKVKEKLEDLEGKQIVKKVNIPKEWISSIVVVSTPSKIRISLDPQDLNKAVIRPKYQMPTLDKLLPKLSKVGYSLLWMLRMDFIRLD